MNLASRCREAISHVAMLKKELAMHQRRAAEALALQREQTQRMAVNLSAEVSRLSQSASSDDSTEKSPMDIEHILGSSPPPPPPGPPPKATVVPQKVVVEQQAALSPKGQFVSDLDEDESVAETIEENSPPNHGAQSEAKNDSNDKTPIKPAEAKVDQKEVTPPKMYSTPNRHRAAGFTPKFNTPNSASKEEQSTGLFPHSASPKVVFSKPNNYNEEFPPDIITQAQRGHAVEQDGQVSGSSSGRSSPSMGSSLEQRRGIIGMNSIDAFEASFDTTFPETFTPKESESAEKGQRRSGTPTSSSSEIYNPFAPSPARPLDKPERTTQSPISKAQASPSHSVSSNQVSTPGSPVVIRKAYVSDASMFRDSSPPEEKKTPDNSWNDDMQYHTPPKEKRFAEVSVSEEPKRPEKTVSEASRARYEKALQPRNNAHPWNPPKEKNAPSLTVDTSGETFTQKATSVLKGNSPSALLKRIHQRRINKQMNRQQSAPVEMETIEKDGILREMPPKAQMNRQKSAPESMTRSEVSAQPRTIQKESLVVVPLDDAYTTIGQREVPKWSNSVTSTGPAGEQPFDEIEESNGRTDQNSRTDTKAACLNALMKSRRSVKQPVSYAEPALNTKLRKGDVFFQKADGEPQIVTPEQVPAAEPILG